MKMDKKLLDKDGTYMIAECAYSYEGDKSYLERSIKKAATAGCIDAIKFHIMVDADTYMTPDHKVYDAVKAWLLSEKTWEELINTSKDAGLQVIALADDLGSFPFLKSVEKKLAAIEIHACSLNDVTMLEEAACFTVPVILGVGGSSTEEIKYAISYLKKKGKRDIVLMYGFQNYPTRYEYINLKKMQKLAKMFKLPVGYADHTAWNDGYQELITLAAFACGAQIIEKHFVLEKGKKRVDYDSAVSAEDFRSLHEKLTVLQKALGDGSLKLNKYEQAYGKVGPIKKTIVAARNIDAKEKISADDIAFKRTGKESSIRQKDAMKLIGRKAKNRIKKNELITFRNTK
jgi:N,N'-diacetyllegionaminate synthase